MASIQKHGEKWRAAVCRNGIRRSKVLNTRQDARAWAARIEVQLEAGQNDSADTVADLLLKYAREVSDTKRGARWEIVRLKAMRKDPLAQRRLRDLTPQDIADWRDRRLKEVSAGSVLREKNLLSSVFTTARKQWRLLSHNPVQEVMWPASPKARTRMPTKDELARVVEAAPDPETKRGRTVQAFLFACQTAMRAGEIARLTRDAITGRVAHVAITKNGEPRDVPLSSEALRIVEAMPEADTVFDVSAASLSALWRKVCKEAKVEGLTFHDSRRAGTSMLARKLDVMQLAKVTGHKDIRILLNVYYKTDAEELANLLD